MESEKRPSERKMGKIWLALSYAGIIFGFFSFFKAKWKAKGRENRELSSRKERRKKEKKRKNLRLLAGFQMKGNKI